MQSIPENIRLINEWLKEYGGTNPYNEPIFRIAWSSDQVEFRHGTFRDFRGDLFLREVTETRVTKKYNYIIDKWILEKWFPQDMVRNEETPGVLRGDYECFFVFQDKFMNYLEPTRKVVEFIFYATMRGKPTTEREITNEILIKEDQEVQKFMDLVDTSPIGNALHMREGLGYSGTIKKDYKDAN